MEKFAQWMIVALLSWGIFFIILFAGIVPSTSLIKEYGCTITDFHVVPRFECSTHCPIISKTHEKRSVHKHKIDPQGFEYLKDLLEMREEEVRIQEREKKKKDPPKPSHPHCDDLEKETKNYYDANLCLNSPFGIEDPLCPADSVPCLSGRQYTRKCQLKCPLAYNVTVSLDVDHIGKVSLNRDLSTDEDRYKSYKNEYAVGKRTSCQVVLDGNDKVRWVDERLSHKAYSWWKWSLFTASILMALGATIASIVNFMDFRNRANGYERLDAHIPPLRGGMPQGPQGRSSGTV
jgi:hypothetical protein